jgi:uncharacterized membrane protein YvbJ
MNDSKMCPYCDADVKVEAIKCKHCQSMLSAEDDELVGVAATASASPRQAAPKVKKPIWKQWWVWAAVVILFIAIVASGGSNDEEPAAKPEAAVEAPEVVIAEAPEEATKSTETIPEVTDSATLGEKNAAKSALNYLAYTSFSYSGLVDQLKYEGFTHEEAVYGVDRCGANWNEQAAKSAQNYLDYSSFSRDGLIAQLEYEGFTRQQAEYGVQAVGY